MKKMLAFLMATGMIVAARQHGVERLLVHMGLRERNDERAKRCRLCGCGQVPYRCGGLRFAGEVQHFPDWAGLFGTLI